MSEKHVTGPVQVFVVGFDRFEATGRIMAELRRVRRRGVIRVIDILFVQKDKHGSISNSMHLTDLSENERERLGAIAGSLIGLEAGGGIEGALEGAELGAMAVAERDAGLGVDRLKELAESIPAGGAAGILVIEHHWAADLRDAIARGRWPIPDAGHDRARCARPHRRGAAGEDGGRGRHRAGRGGQDGGRHRDRPDARGGGAHRGGRHLRGGRRHRHRHRRRGCGSPGRDRGPAGR